VTPRARGARRRASGTACQCPRLSSVLYRSWHPPLVRLDDERFAGTVEKEEDLASSEFRRARFYVTCDELRLAIIEKVPHFETASDQQSDQEPFYLLVEDGVVAELNENLDLADAQVIVEVLRQQTRIDLPDDAVEESDLPLRPLDSRHEQKELGEPPRPGEVPLKIVYLAVVGHQGLCAQPVESVWRGMGQRQREIS